MKLFGLAALALTTSVSVPVHAQSFTFGSESGSTYRGCGTASAAEACDGSGEGQGIIQSVNTGGTGQIAASDLTLADGSFARGTVSFGTDRLPEIHSETYAAGNERMNSNTVAYQSYTWGGASPIDFSIAGTLHIDSASDSGPDMGGVDGGILPGGAGYFAGLLILDPSVVDGLTPDNFFDRIFGLGCGSAGVLGAGDIGQTLHGGGSFGVSTSACGSGSLTLAAGQTVIVAAELQLPVNRGGFAIATNTFSTAFDPALGADTVAALEANLVPAVPEPLTWALMIGGVAATGGVLRRRRAAPDAGMPAHA